MGRCHGVLFLGKFAIGVYLENPTWQRFRAAGSGICWSGSIIRAVSLSGWFHAVSESARSASAGGERHTRYAEGPGAAGNGSQPETCNRCVPGNS